MIDGPASVVWLEAANRLPTEQALVYALITGWMGPVMTGPSGRPVVVALGGNALLRRGESPDVARQRQNVEVAAAALAAVARDHRRRDHAWQRAPGRRARAAVRGVQHTVSHSTCWVPRRRA